MPQYLAPGVYVEEVSSAIKPIAGVGTSTAGFVGLVADNVTMPPQPGKFKLKAKGKPGDPDELELDPDTKEPIPIPYSVAKASEAQPINSWGEFTQKFGAIQAGNQYLAHAVYGFFNNGGTRCWVIRVTKTDPDVSNAIDPFEGIDEIAIVAAPLPPDTAAATLNGIHGKLVSHCEKMKDRVAILDSTRNITTDNLVISTDDTGIWRPAANKKGYGAFYFPWIEVADPLAAGQRIAVPPSGHLAGVYARSDAERGVHKAPANEVILGALGVRYPVSKFLQEILNPKGVNCIRSFNGTIKVYGARTLASDPQGDPEWQYINVRRLFNFLRESIDQGTQWVVFEPNSELLWAKIRRNVTAFLTTVWASGALFGATPQEAFYVRCDAETNPPEVREPGQVVTEIGVAVVKPAEFVIFRVSQWAGAGK